MAISVVLAIFVGLACSFIQSLGLTIQRKSHVQDEAKPEAERQRAVRRPLWIIGFAIYISSNIFGSVFQIGALPIVVLAPLGGVSLLWNSVLAHVLLGEGFTSAMLLGTVLIATGAVLIAIFGVVPDDNHSLDELLALWARPPFVAFFTLICLSVAAVLVLAHTAVWRVQGGKSSGGIRLPDDEAPSNYASPRNEPAIPFRPTNGIPVDTPRSSVSSVEQIQGADKMVRFAEAPETPQDRTLAMCGLAFAAASGTLSGLCLVLAKAAVELVIATIDHWSTGRGQNEFARVQTWFLVAGLGLAAVLQLVYLNYSLAFASPALICPLAFCFYNLASIFDGLVFYDQFGRLRPHQVALVSVGVAVLLVGVWTVSAVQPTGDGGVEVGTWVEEEWTHEDATYFEEAVVDEPEEVHDDELEAGHGATMVRDAEAGPAHDHGHPVSAPSARSPPPRLPRIDSGVTSPVKGAPHTPSEPQSPQPPVSPSHRRRRPRYGTLIPELGASGGMPTGFSFGIGVASPGFALRSNSITQAHAPSRGRSHSDATAARPGRLGPRMSLPAHAPMQTGPTEEHVAQTIASWDRPDESQRRWSRLRLPRLFGGTGVKLP